VTGKFVETNAAKYPYLAKAPEFVDAVFSDYTAAKGKLEAEGSALGPAEQAKLMLDALAVHEEKWAKRLGAPGTTTETASPGIDGAARAGVREPPPVIAKKLTFEELKAERAAKRRSA
jgi:hypothetical protein